MKIKEITLHYHLKHSLPHFGSVQYGAGMTIELEEFDVIGSNEKELYEWGWKQVQSQVLKQMNNRLPTQELKEQLDLLTNDANKPR